MDGQGTVPAAAAAPPRRAALAALRGPVLLSLANQALGSGGNFLLGLYLARSMPLAEFGLYGICYGLCMLYVGVGNAMLLTQMTVAMADQDAAERPAYAARMLCGVLLLGALLLALALPAALLLAALGWPYWRAVALVALAAALMLCAEFFVSHAYLRRRERGALLVNGATMLTLAGGLLALRQVGVAPSADAALLLYALGAGLGAAMALAANPLALRQDGAALRRELAGAWRHGRWALGGVGVTWLQAQSASYALAATLGPAGAGLAGLGRLFISPFSFLLPAVNKVAVPRLAALRRSDPRRMRRLSTALTAALALLAAGYAVALLACLSWLAPLLLGRAPPALAPLVRLWCLVLLFQVVRSGGALLLQMQMKFKPLTLMNIPSAALALGAAVLLMRRYAEAGAVAGVLAGEVLLAVLIWREIRHEARAVRADLG
jgi:O-antigen/teichoic acid export membrane protein